MIEFLWFYTKLGFWHVVDWEAVAKVTVVGNYFYNWTYPITDRELLFKNSLFIVLDRITNTNHDSYKFHLPFLSKPKQFFKKEISLPTFNRCFWYNSWIGFWKVF